MSFLDKLQEGLSGMGDAVKGAAGNVWDAIQPAEAQAISPEEILKYNIKQAFNTSGRILTPELTGQISQVAMPLLRKTPSYHQQRAQGSLFNSLLKTPNPETYNPEFISGHVKGMSRVPDWMFENFPTDVNYKDPASFSEGTFGSYFHNPRNAAADVGINPAFPYAIPTAKRLAVSLDEADKVIPHELNHVAAYASKDAIKNSPIADAWDDIATVRGTGKILDNLNTKSKYYFNNFTNENITPYDIQPRELAARYFASHLADGEKDIPGLFKASMKFATTAIKDAYPSISKLGEEQGDKIRGLVLPLLLAGGVGAGVLGSAEEGNTAPANIQAMSNFDRAEEAKSFFNPAGKVLSEAVPMKGIGDVATDVEYTAQNNLVQKEKPTTVVSKRNWDDYSQQLGPSTSVNPIKGGGLGEYISKNTKDVITEIPNLINFAAPVMSKAGSVGVGVLDDLINPSSTSEIGSYGDVSDLSFKSPHGFREDPNTYKDKPVLENVLLGGLAAGLGAAALKSPLLRNEAGAINMPGFFSKLTTALDTMKAGKVPLSTKMTGKGLEQALKAGGISADELKFTGLGKELARIGDKTLGAAHVEDLSKRGEVFGKVDMREMGSAKMKELARQAEENALPFSKKVTPGIHSQYSLFKSGDPSFKNNVYKYPGTNFEEDHFGKDVVAHSRGGDKEVTLGSAPADPKRMQLDDPLKSYHVDELQSQLHQRGGTVGYGELKKPSEFDSNFSVINRHLNTESNSGRSKLSKDLFDKKDIEYRAKYPDTYTKAVEYSKTQKEVESFPRSTPQEFAEYLTKSKEVDNKFKSYTTNIKPVGDVPMQKDKWIELLAKDHLQEALKNGKDSISLTPAEEQFKRYYGKNPDPKVWRFKDGKLTVTFVDGSQENYNDLASLRQIGKGNSKKIVENLSKGHLVGKIEPEKNLDIYKGTYSEYERKMEGLTGGKFQDGWTKNGQGKDVKVRVLKLDEAKKKFVEEEKTVSLGDVRKELSPISSSVEVIGDDVNPIKDHLTGALKWSQDAILDTGNKVSDLSQTMTKESFKKVSSILNFGGESTFAEDTITDPQEKVKFLDSVLAVDKSLTKDEKNYLLYNKTLIEKALLSQQVRDDLKKLKEVGKQNNKVKPFPIAKAQEAIDFFNPTKQALA